MMNSIFVFFIVIASSFTSHADLGTEIDSLLKDSVALGKTHLPDMIRSKQAICSQYSVGTVQREACLKNLFELASSKLHCEKNVSRWQEMGAKDRSDMAAILKNYPEVVVPADVQKVFLELTVLADKMWVRAQQNNSLPVGVFPLPQWNIRAYNATFNNAHAGSDGSVLISNNFWNSKTPFSIDEIRAIVAHEVGHVILNHSLQIGCIYFEWGASDPDVSLLEAQEIVRQDFSVSMGSGKAWSDLSQRNEFQADAQGIELLQALGGTGRAMVTALEKLSLSSQGGFSSGTHPDMKARAERARAQLQGSEITE